ncbi:uncharacterized protein LOC143038805 isoform X2 [Oratosquilla oratoria]|uniref:uncharacterized protein LOC143038805 isoform X2 n=1 Tax=Oratosquilla oratoria TaxID=337810 RepID=UPI003F765823
MEIPLALVCDTIAQKKKPWSRLSWIGKETSKLYHVHHHRVGEIILPGGQVSKIAKLEDITKQAVAINYSYRGLYVFGLLSCGDVFMWNNGSKKLRLIEGIPELTSHLSSLHSEKGTAHGSVLNQFSNWSHRSTGKTRASDAGEQSSEVSCYVPHHQRPKIWGADDLSKIVVVIGGNQIYLWECESNAENAIEKVQGSWSVVKDSDDHPLPNQDNRESVISASFINNQAYGDSYHISFIFISNAHLVCTTCVLVWSGIQHKVTQNALGHKVLNVEVMQPQQVMTHWYCKKESLLVLWNKPDVVSHHKGALVVSHAHNCGILSIAINSHRPLSSKLVQLKSASDAVVAVDVQGSPRRSDPRFHWIQDLTWTKDNVYVVGCMRSGAIFLALRLGPLVQISCTGQGIQLPLSTLLQVHPLPLQPSEVNKKVTDVEDISTSTESYPSKHIIFRVSTHSQEDLILFTSGLRIFVFRLPDNAAKDSDVADQLLGCAWHGLHQLRKSPLSHQYAYIRSSTWRLTRISTLDISQSSPHQNSWNDVSVWENVTPSSHETSLNNSQYAGQSLFQNVLDPLLAAIVLTASYDGPETLDWKKRRKKISFCILVVLKTLLNQDDNGAREDCMKKLQQVLRIFHEIQQIFELGHGHSYFLYPSIQLLHRLIHAVLKKRKQSGKQEVIDSLLILASFLRNTEKTLIELYEMKSMFHMPGNFLHKDIEVCQGFCVSSGTGFIGGVPQYVKGNNIAVRMKKIWICLYKNIELFYLRTKMSKGMDSKSCQKLRTVIAIVQERLQRFNYEFKNIKVKLNPGVEMCLIGKNLNAIEKWKSEISELIHDPSKVKEIKSRMHSILYMLIYLRRFYGVIEFVAWLCTLLMCVISSPKSFSHLVPQKTSTPDPKNMTKDRSIQLTKEVLELSKSVNSIPENMWKRSNSVFKAVTLVVRSLGRIIARSALGYDIHIPPVHNPHIISSLWNVEKNENVLPHGWMKPPVANDKSLQDIKLSSEDLWSPECGARLLLLAGDWCNLSYMARQMGDIRLTLLTAVLTTRVKTRERIPETLHLSSLITSVITSTLISGQSKATDFEGIQELLQLSAMVDIQVIVRLLSESLAKVKSEMENLPLLVPWEVDIPAPPLFCPQPSNGDVNTEDLKEGQVRAVISDWIRLAITVLSSASLGKFLLLEYCNEAPKVNDKEKYQDYALNTLKWAQELSGFTRYQSNMWHSDLLSVVLTAAFNVGGCSEAASCVAAVAGDVSLLPCLLQDKAQRLMDYWRELSVSQDEAVTILSHIKHRSSPNKNMKSRTEESSVGEVTMFELYEKACKDHHSDCTEELRLNNIILWEEHTSMVLLLASLTFVKDNEVVDQASLFRPLLVQYGRVLREKEFHSLIIAHEIMRQFYSRGKNDAEQVPTFSTNDSLCMLTLSNMTSHTSEDQSESKGLFRSLSKRRLHQGATGSVTLQIHNRSKTLRNSSPRSLNRFRKGRQSQSLSRGRSLSPRSRKERKRLSRASFHLGSSDRSSSSKRPEKVMVNPHLLLEEVIDILEKEYDVQRLIPQETLGLVLWIMSSERKFVNLDMGNLVKWDPKDLSHMSKDSNEDRKLYDNLGSTLKVNIDNMSVLKGLIFSNLQFDYIDPLKSETGELSMDEKSLKNERKVNLTKRMENKDKLKKHLSYVVHQDGEDTIDQEVLSKDRVESNGKEAEAIGMEITDGPGKPFSSKTENVGLHSSKNSTNVEEDVDNFEGYPESQPDNTSDRTKAALFAEHGNEEQIKKEQMQEFSSEEAVAEELEVHQVVDTTSIKEHTHEKQDKELPMEPKSSIHANVEKQKVELRREEAVKENLSLQSRRACEQGKNEGQHESQTVFGGNIRSAVQNELQTILQVQQAGIIAMMDAVKIMQRGSEHGISHVCDEMAFAQSNGQIFERGNRRVRSDNGGTKDIQKPQKERDIEGGMRMDVSVQVSPTANTWKPFRLSQESSKKTSQKIIQVQEADKTKTVKDIEGHRRKKMFLCSKASQPQTFSNNSVQQDFAIGSNNVPEVSSLDPVDDTLDDITLPDSLHASDLEEEVGNIDSSLNKYMQIGQVSGGTYDIRLDHQIAGMKSVRSKTLDPQNEVFRPQPPDYRRHLLWNQEHLHLRKIPIKVQPRNSQELEGKIKKEKVNIPAGYAFTGNKREVMMSKPFKLLALPKSHSKGDEKINKPMILKKLPTMEKETMKSRKDSEKKRVMLQEKDIDLRNHIEDDIKHGYNSAMVNFKPMQVPKVLPNKAKSSMSLRFLEPSEVMAFYEANLQHQKSKAFRKLKIEPVTQRKELVSQRKEPMPQKKEFVSQEKKKTDRHDDNKNGHRDKSLSKLGKHFLDQVEDYAKQYKRVTEQYHLTDNSGEMNLVANEGKATQDQSRTVTNAVLQYVATQKVNIAPEPHLQEEKETQTAVDASVVKIGTSTNRLVRQKGGFDEDEVNEPDKNENSPRMDLGLAEASRRETDTLEEELVMTSNLAISRQKYSYGKMSDIEEPCRTRHTAKEEPATSNAVNIEPEDSLPSDNVALLLPSCEEVGRNSVETSDGGIKNAQTTKHELCNNTEVIISEDISLRPTSTEPAVFVPHNVPETTTSTDAVLLNLVDIPDNIVKEKLDAYGEVLNKTIEIDDYSWSDYRSSQKSEKGIQEKLNEINGNVQLSNLVDDSEGAHGKEEVENNFVGDIGSDLKEVEQKSESSEPKENEIELPLPKEKGINSQPFLTQQVAGLPMDRERDQRVKVAVSLHHDDGTIDATDEILVFNNDRVSSCGVLSFDKVPEIESCVITKEVSLDDLMNAFTQGKITFEELYKLSHDVRVKSDDEKKSSAVDVKADDSHHESNENGIIQGIEVATDEVFQGLRESKYLMENIDILMKTSEDKMEKTISQITNRSKPEDTHTHVNEQYTKSFQLEKTLDSVSERELIDFIENIDPDIALTDAFIEKIMLRIQKYRSNTSDEGTRRVTNGKLSQESFGSPFQLLVGSNSGKEVNTPKSVIEGIDHYLAETARSHHLEDLRINLSGIRSVSSVDTYKTDLSPQNGKVKKQKHRAEIRKWMKQQRFKRKDQEKKHQQLNCISKIQLDTFRSINQDGMNGHHKLNSTFTISAENQGLTGKQLRERSQEREKAKLEQKRSFQNKREEIILSMMEDLTDGLTTHRDILEKDHRKCLLPSKQTSEKQKTTRGSGTKRCITNFHSSVGNHRNSAVFEKTHRSIEGASGSKNKDSASGSSGLTIGSSIFMTSPCVDKNVMVSSEKCRTFRAKESTIKNPIQDEVDKLVLVLGSHGHVKEKRRDSETSTKHPETYHPVAEKNVSKLESLLNQPVHHTVVGQNKKTGEEITHKELTSSVSFLLDRISEVDSDASADQHLDIVNDKIEQISGTNASSDSSWTVPDNVKNILYE